MQHLENNYEKMAAKARALFLTYDQEEIVRRNALDTLMTYFERIGCEALLLGCTHFPYIKDALAACFSRPIIDPAEEMVKLLLA